MVKVASEGVAPPVVLPNIHELRDQNKIELVRKTLLTSLLAAGAGAGFRSLAGLNSYIGRHTDQKTQLLPSRTNILHLSASTTPQPRKRIAKYANLTPPQPAGYDAAKNIASRLGMLNPTGKARGFGGFLAGDNSGASIFSIPASAMLPVAGLASLGGGYSLADWILNKTRKKELDSEVSIAQSDYENALRGLGNVGKVASEDKYAALNQLASQYENAQTQTKTAIYDWLGSGAAVALAGSALLGGASAKLTFDHIRASDKAKVLNEAFRRRQQQLYNQYPFPTVAVIDEPSEKEKRQPAEKAAA